MKDENSNRLFSLEVDIPIWDRFFKVSSLVLIGTRDENGEYNQAPKHMAIPMGWENFFGFICTPAHSTYQNIKREKEFTVTYPRPSQILFASLAASPRNDDSLKPSLSAIPTRQAEKVDGSFVADGYAFLECQLYKVVDGFGENSLIVGQVIAAQVHQDSLRQSEVDDNDLIQQAPPLAYLDPDRFTRIMESFPFPFPREFSR